MEEREENGDFSNLHDIGDGDGDVLSPVSSRYSSSGESEFGRDCSANMCGSSLRAFSDCNEDFGSRGRNVDDGGSSGERERDVNKVGDYVERGLSEEEELEVSSRGEYSGGEDSGFEDGLIREVRIDVQQSMGKVERGNPLVMGSSETYGVKDWDDFVEHNGEDILTDLSLDYPFQGNEYDFECKDHPSDTLYDTELGILEPESSGIEADMTWPKCSRHTSDAPSQISNLCRNASESEQGEMVMKDIHLLSCQSQGIEGGNVYIGKDDDECGALMKKSQVSDDVKVIGIQKNYTQESRSKSEVNMDPLYVAEINQVYSTFKDPPEEGKSNHIGDHESEMFTLMFLEERSLNHPSVSSSTHADSIKPIKMDSPELNESLDDFVTEMEEILMDTVTSPGFIHNQGSNIFQSHLSLPSRAVQSAASTSDLKSSKPSFVHAQRIDGVEVVGALQKKGDVSLGERLVGVKEYTVYRIRLWSGNNRWEVERRYRDFCTLYRRLKALYADRNLALPSPWLSIEQESRKIFGSASPDVVAERSILIQECLSSVLKSRILSSSPNPLLLFLSAQDSFISTSTSRDSSSGTVTSSKDNDTENNWSLGMTISLIVENKQIKSVKQQLEMQHYTCAGCHQYFNEGKTVMLEIMHSLGWGKPRLCEYSGQLFCHSCHTNDMSVLPARVLHQWDFTEYPVSQMAKSYLDSIHDQCGESISLLLVMNIRKKIGAMLPYLRCPFRRTVNKGLGSRRYLLDNNDFFSLRDLIDLSRGPFSELPVTVETISRKILEHITEQCLLCCDVGVVCGAKQSCSDPMSLIFPFQDSDIKKCRSCGLVFHEPCFKKLTKCPCEAHLRINKMLGSANEIRVGANSEAGALSLDFVGKNLASSLSETISGFFSKTTR